MSVIVEVEIEGVTSFLMHRFTDADANGDAASRNVLVTRGTPREEATKCEYRTPTGELYFPGTCIGRMLSEAGGGHKMKGSRKSAKYLVPAAVIVLDDAILFRGIDGKVLSDYEVDSRPVTIPATKGRIMRHRPRIDRWRARFSLRVNPKVLPIDLIHKLMQEGGEQQGIGDYRPQKGGPFGTFRVIHWHEVVASEEKDVKGGKSGRERNDKAAE